MAADKQYDEIYALLRAILSFYNEHHQDCLVVSVANRWRLSKEFRPCGAIQEKLRNRGGGDCEAESLPVFGCAYRLGWAICDSH